MIYMIDIVKICCVTMDKFVKMILFKLYENKEEPTNVEKHEIVNMNVYRKQLIDQVLALLKAQETNLYNLLSTIPNYLGMHIFECSGKETCDVSKTNCNHCRRIVLCNKMEDNIMIKDTETFVVRSDIVKIVRHFYTYNHFGFLVMLKLNDGAVIEEAFIKDLNRKMETCERTLRSLIEPLRYRTE